MKKSIFLFAVGLAVLTSCDPEKEEKDFNVTNITADALLSGATFEQFADDACTTPAADGNWIKFNVPSVQAVTIFAKKADGSENILCYGKSGGVFNYVPKRGSDPSQTLYFRYVNQNGEEVVATHDFTVQVAADLAPEIKLLVSDEGEKVWKWDTSAPDGQFWGNMGGNGGYDNKDFALTGNGKWWGVTSTEEFATQTPHAADGLIGDHDTDATMVINEDGDILCYDKDGNPIRQGKYSITDWNPEATNGPIGILHTDAGSILWPYEINSGGRKPTWFEIVSLTPAKLVLAYPDNGAWNTGGWSEGTFWRFSSTTDIKGCLTDNSEATWTWVDDANCWGNAGYAGFAYGGAASLTGGQWWGVNADELPEQFTNYKYNANDGQGATMTLNADGLITKSSGGNGTFAYDAKNTKDIGGWEEGKTLGRFTTTGDGILFPVRINAGTITNEFDIVYISDDRFVLAYPNDGAVKANEGSANWQECTFWRFKKVK